MKTRLSIIATLIIVTVMLLVGCGAAASESSDDSAQAGGSQKSYPKLKEGSEAPDFTAEINDGSSYTLSEEQGKVVLLNFWATWCGPCVEEMPALQKLYNEYGDKIEILAVDTSEDRDTVDAFISEKGYTFPIAYDENGEISAKYPTDGIPYTLVIGKDGKVSAAFLGSNGADEQYKKYRSALKEAFSE